MLAEEGPSVEETVLGVRGWAGVIHQRSGRRVAPVVGDARTDVDLGAHVRNRHSHQTSDYPGTDHWSGTQVMGSFERHWVNSSVNHRFPLEKKTTELKDIHIKCTWDGPCQIQTILMYMDWRLLFNTDFSTNCQRRGITHPYLDFGLVNLVPTSLHMGIQVHGRLNTDFTYGQSWEGRELMLTWTCGGLNTDFRMDCRGGEITHAYLDLGGLNTDFRTDCQEDC